MLGAAPRGGVSRRRAVLVVLGLGWAGYGALGILANPRAGTSELLAEITRWVPMTVLGWLWVAAGTVALGAGLVTNCPRVQAAGFAALSAVSGLWAAAFVLAIPRAPTASGSASIWTALAVAVVVVSGMDDPLPRAIRKRWR
ncbi:hypothetical protein OG599_35135 (plasmid) [Streptomyces sp. NBC_01335]|uniref:hypothetical protein n=1 Tax=Streptomyces sp. NBC_01335 TaxID=2903828 RepID=UPI002E0E9E9E|nr:hypothetical protein OG599_35135 [Streptomyces sp. NBC_01335]